MKWFSHTNLSDNDFTALAGTEVMVSFMRNRIVVVWDKDKIVPTPKEMGLHDLSGLYYLRFLQKETHVFELLFELKEDCEIVEQYLTQCKLRTD